MKVLATEILVGDVREKLAELPDASVHCVVTSPPYWGLRDYGVEGQLGLEPTLQAHVEAMVAVFREVKRVLRPDGVCWVNYGDSYATSVNGRSAADTKSAGNDDRTFRDKPFGTAVGGLKPKDLCLVPFRFALAMQEDGWWLRSILPWVKRNAMPESIKDRPATSVEYVFLFSKSARYFYDAEAVRRERVSEGGDEKAPKGWATGDTPHNAIAHSAAGQSRGRQTYGKHTLGENVPPAERRAKHGDDTDGAFRRLNGANGKSTLGDKQRGHGRPHAGFNDRWDAMKKAEQQAAGRNFRNTDLFFESIKPPHGLLTDEAGEPLALDVPPQPFREAHFATFPVKLIDPLIRAGCPVSGTVLDPFGGAGTTGLVANRLGREAILIELNPQYAELAVARIAADAKAQLGVLFL